MENKVQKYFCYMFCVIVLFISCAAFKNYPGKWYVYILFTIALNALLFFGFRKNRLFFDTFIGILFWLGFWLKLSVRVGFLEGKFCERFGSFDFSGTSYDHALVVTTCGVAALLAASIIREKWIFRYPDRKENKENIGLEGLFIFYKTHRKLILIGFVGLFLAISLTNMYFGIYQKGMVSRTILPFGLRGIYSWLLLFGATSISAILLNFDFNLKKSSYLVVFFSLLESFFSSVSMLSRGMVINVSSLALGAYEGFKNSILASKFRLMAFSLVMFFILFSCSIIIATHLRGFYFSKGNYSHSDFSLKYIPGTTRVLVLDRWVGIEGVMAVSSSDKLGWDLWKKAWNEKYFDYGTSLYDLDIIATSSYAEIDTSKLHHISTPGILAFFYYPGSLFFLFFSMFLIGLIGAGIEIFVHKLGESNLILCSLFAQVVAYRYAHFGYVPGQSYLLFGALFLNMLLIYYANKFLLFFYKSR
ncbi:conserved membrane hypothetical protein [Candidatus Desulfarcum epimagneticum]|uniref:O-antigen polysaccharide polymerase Wzy n=1 Tax=uncultured Desulfobacteraceae bacterium TaxID=218296 RepID=A0A484HJR4_9BACT|nr:conserved membrane hypothetical protein [uncultured Desulfobacteraceae bacterium]